MSNSFSHNPNLYQWKRFTKPKLPEKKKKSTSKENDIEKWLKKVEAATEDAVQKTFRDDYLCRGEPVLSSGDDILQVVSDIHENENAHSEARELVSDWINEKLKFDLLAGSEKDYHLAPVQADERTGNAHVLTSGIETAAHEKWYEDSEIFLQRYLDSAEQKSDAKHHRETKAKVEDNSVLGQLNIYEADEATVINALMKNMIEKPLLTPSELKALKKKDNDGNKKKFTRFRDPKTTMDMRHKEVKQARLKRENEGERRRQERLMQKDVKFKAQQILKEEELQKKLREKQEEEAIQVEMAKLRREVIEQRKREEKRRKETEKELEKVMSEGTEERTAKRQEMEKRERVRQKENILSEISYLEEKENKVAEIMKRQNAENRRLVKICFSTWCKLVLNQRVKMGKAKAMSDWKCMQQVFSGWKSYARDLKLDFETKNHQAIVRETRLKDKKAVNCARLRLLRKTFFLWKVWIKREQERKEILEQQQNTKAKMQMLLNAVTSRHIDESSVLQSLDSQDEALPQFKPQKSCRVVAKQDGKEKPPSVVYKPGVPKEAWQVTRKDVRRLKADDMKQLSHAGRRAANERVLKIPHASDPYENRHKFQKEMIDQQRMLLQDQKRMIIEMQEQQSLQALQKEIASLKEQQNVLQNSGSKTSVSKTTATSEAQETPRSRSDSSQLRPRSSIPKKHPVVSKMEERAAERAKRKKELEEMRKKRKEEKLKRIQEDEEKKCKEEEERKMRELQERREEKREQKKLEQEKKEAQERMTRLRRAAENHYTMILIKNYGFKPWRTLINATKKRNEVASYHYKSNILRKALLEWKAEAEKARKAREEKADSLYRVLLLRRGLRCWKKYGKRMEILEERAVLHHNKVLEKQYLKYWVDYTTDEKLSEWRKESEADEHNRRRLLRKVFNVIRSYRELVKREVDRRHRLHEMRRKVTQLLPDFQCTKDSFTSDVLDGDPDEDGCQN